jgi:fumarate hydratase class II
MLPLIAFDLLQQLSLLTAAAGSLNEQAITCFKVDERILNDRVKHNVMLATALTPRIGYALAGKIVRMALAQGLPVIEAARELSGLPDDELQQLLNPERLALGHDLPGLINDAPDTS